jgi:hypothetical protein
MVVPVGDSGTPRLGRTVFLGVLDTKVIPRWCEGVREVVAAWKGTASRTESTECWQ